MLPFMKIPVILTGNPDEKEEEKTGYARIQPSEISSYHDGYYWGSFVYIKGGHVFCSTLTADELEKQIKAYWSLATTGPVKSRIATIH